jgi:molybdate transport repressor ModE-like protein
VYTAEVSVRFDLTDLRLFVQVAETCSITRGADQTHMSLASASARIRGMEEMLGLPLLERGSRGVRPTPAGQALLHHAQMMLQHFERMRGELGNFARGFKGYVRLLANTIAATEILPKALARFLETHPNVDIELEERSSLEIVSAVSEGYADAGIVVDTGGHGDLQTFPFAVDRLVLITPRAHPFRKKRHIAFRDVLDQEFVGLTTGRPLQEFLNRQAALAGSAFKLRVRMTSFDAICQMVEHRVGIAVVSERAARSYRRPGINIIRLTDEWAVRRLLLCVREFSELSVHAKRLVEHLKSK